MKKLFAILAVMGVLTLGSVQPIYGSRRSSGSNRTDY